MSVNIERPIHKISFGLLLFLLLVAGLFDIIGMIPFLGIVTGILFTLTVKLTLSMAGYHAGIMRMILMFLALQLAEAVFSPIPSCTLYVMSFYFFNKRLYALQEKVIQEMEAAKQTISRRGFGDTA